MAKKFAVLHSIDNNREITMESDGPFLCQLEDALLLALKERGILNFIQYRFAKEELHRRRRKHCANLP